MRSSSRSEDRGLAAHVKNSSPFSGWKVPCTAVDSTLQVLLRCAGGYTFLPTAQTPELLFIRRSEQWREYGDECIY
jgi:hypothetical protein